MYKYLGKIMGVYASTAKRKLRHNVELTSKPLLEIVETYKTLEKLNFDKTLITENISVLALSAGEVKQRHRSLKELGIERFQVPEVLRFADIVSQSKESLVSAGFTSSIDFDLRNLDVAKSTNEFGENISTSKASYDDSIVLQVVRCKIIAETIARKLSYDEKIAERMIQSCRPLSLSSLSYVDETLNILTKELKLKEQIRCNPIVLSVPPEDVEDIFSVASEFNLDVRFMALELPRVLCTTPNLFKLICHHMNEYGVSMEALKRFPSVFDHSPEFILYGLKLLSVWPDFKAIRSSLHLFRLLNVSRQANQRLTYLKLDSPENCSLKHLITKDELFKELLANTVREESVGREEMLSYLADKLECSYEDVARNFDLNTDFSLASMAVARNTLIYLLRQGFKKEVISKGSALLLHRWQVVDKVLKELPKLDLAQPYSEWKQNDNVLHLVLYVIKKNEQREVETWDHPQIELREHMDSGGFIADQELRNDFN